MMGDGCGRDEGHRYIKALSAHKSTQLQIGAVEVLQIYFGFEKHFKSIVTV